MAFDILQQVRANFTPRNVSIEEFSESSEFCNKRLYPRQKLLLKLMFLEELTAREEDTLNYWIKGGRGGEILISPFIRERIEFLQGEDFGHFREIVMVGGRRSSKGFITGLSMSKLMFDTLALQDPGAYYGIDAEKQIYFTCLAASLDQARKYQYADFSSTVESCTAFQDNLTKLYEREFSVATESDLRKMEAHRRKSHKIGRDISKLRGIAAAANAATVRGAAAMAIAFDEMAHMEVGEETEGSADKVYEAAIPSLAQFGRDAMIFCNSSPYTKLGKFFERYEAAMLTNQGKPANPLVMALQFPSHALFEGWWEEPLYKGKKRCITASPDWNDEKRNEDGSLFYTLDDRHAILIAREEERQNPEVFKVERRARFAEVIDAYLDPNAVDRMFLGRPTQNLDEYIPFSTNWNDPNGFLYTYKAHLDPSSTTAGFGFAMGHIEMYPTRDGDPQEHVVFDIIKRWQPERFASGVIEWEVVMKEIFGYVDMFRPVEVTCDQFQSNILTQWLTNELRKRSIGGVRVFEKTATAQTNWNRAEVFRTVLYQNLVHGPHDSKDTEYASLELKYLQQHNTGGRFPRVDKQDIGRVTTKDMADAIMSVTEGLIGNIIATRAMEGLGQTSLRPGAAGGYPIGGADRGGKGDSPFGDLYAKRRGEQQGIGSRMNRRGSSAPNPARSGSWSVRGRGRFPRS